jgi:hypothetical protein
MQHRPVHLDPSLVQGLSGGCGTVTEHAKEIRDHSLPNQSNVDLPELILSGEFQKAVRSHQERHESLFDVAGDTWQPQRPVEKGAARSLELTRI